MKHLNMIFTFNFVSQTLLMLWFHQLPWMFLCILCARLVIVYGGSFPWDYTVRTLCMELVVLYCGSLFGRETSLQPPHWLQDEQGVSQSYHIYHQHKYWCLFHAKWRFVSDLMRSSNDFILLWTDCFSHGTNFWLFCCVINIF